MTTPPRWTESEIEIVRALYAEASWRDLQNALPGRTKKGIARAAALVGVQRAVYLGKRDEATRLRTKRATAKRTAQREELVRQGLGISIKMAAVRRVAGLSGAETLARLARLREAKDVACEPGTCRASNGVTLAKPGQAYLYNERTR